MTKFSWSTLFLIGVKMEKIFTDRKYKIPIILLIMLLWGSAFPTLKISYEVFQMEPSDYFLKIYFAGLRFFLAGLITLFYIKVFVKEKIEVKKEDWKVLITIALIQITFQYIFFYIGVGNTSGMKSSILQSLSSFLIVVLSAFIFKDDELNARKIISVILGLLGVAVININSGFDFEFTLSGEGAVFVATLFSTAGILYVKARGYKIRPFIITLMQMLIGSSILIIVGRLGTDAHLKWSLEGFLLLFYGGFLSATAFTLWYTILKYNKSGEVSVYMLFIPVFGTILSSILLPEEKITANIMIGLILVVAGTIILNTNKGKLKYENKNR